MRKTGSKRIIVPPAESSCRRSCESNYSNFKGPTVVRSAAQKILTLANCVGILVAGFSGYLVASDWPTFWNEAVEQRKFDGFL